MELAMKICDEKLLQIKFAIACDSLEDCCNTYHSNGIDCIFCEVCPRLGPFCSNEHLQRHKATLTHSAQCCLSGEAKAEHINHIAEVLGIQFRTMAYKRKFIRQIKFHIFSVCDCKTWECDCKSIIKLQIKNSDRQSPYSQVDLRIKF